MHESISEILNYYQRHTDKLVILLGLIELCKVSGVKNLDELVNRYKMKPEKFRFIQNYLFEDDAFMQLLQDEYLEAWMDLMGLSMDKYDKGSIQYFMNLKKGKK